MGRWATNQKLSCPVVKTRKTYKVRSKLRQQTYPISTKYINSATSEQLKEKKHEILIMLLIYLPSTHVAILEFFNTGLLFYSKDPITQKFY